MSSDLAGAAELQWTQPKWSKRVYELRAGDALLATLEYPSSWKSHAHVRFGDDVFLIKPEGFFETRYTIRATADGEPIASGKNTFGSKSEVQFANGRSFKVMQKGFWRPEWQVVAPDNAVLLSQTRAKGIFRSNAIVTLSPAAAQYPEIRMLLPLVHYLRLGAERAAAAAAT